RLGNTFEDARIANRNITDIGKARPREKIDILQRIVPNLVRAAEELEIRRVARGKAQVTVQGFDLEHDIAWRGPLNRGKCIGRYEHSGADDDIGSARTGLIDGARDPQADLLQMIGEKIDELIEYRRVVVDYALSNIDAFDLRHVRTNSFNAGSKSRC